MALFGERSSESPRALSPWTQALAKNSPAISVISRNEIGFDPSPLGTRTSGSPIRRPSESSNTLRTPSQLSLSTVNDLDDPADAGQLPESLTSSLASSSAFQRLCSSGVSENLILSPAPGYTSSASASTSTSSSVLLGSVANSRQGVSGGLLGCGYEGVKLIAERDKVGHIEYKLRLLPPNTERFERLTTQLKWRLQEGGGQAVYEIGVLDDGSLIGITDEDMDRSLQTLELMAAELGATVMVLRTITLASPPPFPKALLGYEGGGSQDEGNEEEPESVLDVLGNESNEGSHRKAKQKKKKSPKEQKSKKKPSVFSISEVQGFDNLDEAAAAAAVPSSIIQPEHNGVHQLSNPADHHERAKIKCESKMARRRLSSGFSSSELSARQRKGWGVDRKGGSIWDEWGDDPSEDDKDKSTTSKNSDSARDIHRPVEVASVPSIPVPTSPGRVNLELGSAPVAESWRARNMERAMHQDSTRWRDKPALTQAEREEVQQFRKARRKHKRDNHLPERNGLKDRDGFDVLFGSEVSEDEHSASKELEAGSRDQSDGSRGQSRLDDDGCEMFAFDAFASSESVSQPLTQAALAALNASASEDKLLKKGLHGSPQTHHHTAAAYSQETFLNAKSSKKQTKKRRVRVERAEERRLDLLRGDGITAEGMPLAFDFDSHVGLTSAMEAAMNDGLSDGGEDDDSNALKRVVRRLVGDVEHDCGEVVGGRRGNLEIARMLSTSPSYTIKPTSPSAQRLFSLPLPPLQTSEPFLSAMSSAHTERETDPSPPSPSDTITMPLDSLSLSFSHAEVCTAISPARSTRSDGREEIELASFSDRLASQTPIITGSTQNTHSKGLQGNNEDKLDNLDLSNARLCVEALIVKKKMDMDERYLDFSGFI